MVESRLEVLAPFSAALGKLPPLGTTQGGTTEGVGKKGQGRSAACGGEESEALHFHS